MVSDLPDYTRYIALNVDIPPSQQPAGDPGKYQSSPVDVSDGSRTPLLTDVKGRIIAVLIQGEAETNIIQVKPGQYLASPPDLSEADRISFLTDIKGRVIAALYQGTTESDILQVIARPKGGIHEVGSVTTTAAYQTLASRTVANGKKFELAKILLSCDEDVMYKLRWDGSDVSAEVIVPANTPFTDWFPWDYEEMVGDGVKVFDVQVKYPSGGAAGTCSGEFAGEEL